MKKLSKRKLITIILSSLLTVAITVVTLVLIFQGSSDNGSEFNPTTDSYLSDKPHITSDTPSATSTTVSMAEAISNPSGTQTIRISSADDLYNFSLQCDGSNSANFLKRNYVLTSNINFANRTNLQIKPFNIFNDEELKTILYFIKTYEKEDERSFKMKEITTNIQYLILNILKEGDKQYEKETYKKE